MEHNPDSDDPQQQPNGDPDSPYGQPYQGYPEPLLPPTDSSRAPGFAPDSPGYDAPGLLGGRMDYLPPRGPLPPDIEMGLRYDNAMSELNHREAVTYPIALPPGRGTPDSARTVVATNDAILTRDYRGITVERQGEPGAAATYERFFRSSDGRIHKDTANVAELLRDVPPPGSVSHRVRERAITAALTKYDTFLHTIHLEPEMVTAAEVEALSAAVREAGPPPTSHQSVQQFVDNRIVAERAVDTLDARQAAPQFTRRLHAWLRSQGSDPDGIQQFTVSGAPGNADITVAAGFKNFSDQLPPIPFAEITLRSALPGKTIAERLRDTSPAAPVPIIGHLQETITYSVPLNDEPFICVRHVNITDLQNNEVDDVVNRFYGDTDDLRILMGFLYNPTP